MTPKQVIAERIGEHQAAACIDLLKEAGWIVVRHDAIRLAQADERAWYKNGTLSGGYVHTASSGEVTF